MKNFTLITLLLSLITFTNFGQCNLDSTFFAASNASNNLNYTFGVNDSSNTCSFFWDFGDNNFSSSPMPNHTFNQAGTYNICLTIGACDSTCYDTICQTITIQSQTSNCNLDSSFIASVSQISNLNYSFGLTDTANVCYYNWSFGDGASSSQPYPNHTYNQAGNYNVCLTIGSCDSTCYDTICQTITIQSQTSNCNLDSSFIASVSQISNLNYSFGLTDTANVCYYNWSFGDGASSNQPYPNHTYNQAGNYNVCLTIGSCDSTCYDTICQSVTVSGNGCNISSNFNYGTSPITQPLTYDFTPIDSTGIVSYSWSFGDGNNSTISTPIHTYAQPGTYNVCLIVTAANGCVDTTCLNIPISNIPCNISAAFNSSMSNNDSLTYTFNFIDSTSGCNTFWDFGDGTSGQGDFVSHTFMQPGTYTICASIWSCPNNCADTVCQTVIVGNNTSPCNITANYQWFQLYDSLNGNWVNAIYVINYSTIGSNVSHFWDFGDGNTSTLTFPSHTYTNVGSYSVCLTITDSLGCTETYCDSIYVQTKASGFTLNVISQEEASVGIENERNIELGNIFPNPTNQEAFIQVNSLNNKPISINIFDLNGKIVESTSFNLIQGTNTIQLNTSFLTSGVYIVNIHNDNFNENKRLIKK